MEMGSRDDSRLAHATIDMYAKDLEVQTTVGLTATARGTVATVEIGLHSTMHSNRQTRLPCTNLQHLNTQFMSQDAGIGEEGLLTPKGMQIGAAHPNLVYTHQGLTRAGDLRVRHLKEAQLARCI